MNYITERIPIVSPETEIRLRCLEAAVKALSHNQDWNKEGQVLQMAKAFEDFIYEEAGDSEED